MLLVFVTIRIKQKSVFRVKSFYGCRPYVRAEIATEYSSQIRYPHNATLFSSHIHTSVINCIFHFEILTTNLINQIIKRREKQKLKDNI